MNVRLRLKEEGFRVEADTRSERIKFKIREHSLQKIPVSGSQDREVEEERLLSVDLDPKTTSMTLEDFIASLKEEIETRAIYNYNALR